MSTNHPIDDTHIVIATFLGADPKTGERGVVPSLAICRGVKAFTLDDTGSLTALISLVNERSKGVYPPFNENSIFTKLCRENPTEAEASYCSKIKDWAEELRKSDTWYDDLKISVMTPSEVTEILVRAKSTSGARDVSVIVLKSLIMSAFGAIAMSDMKLGNLSFNDVIDRVKSAGFDYDLAISCEDNDGARDAS